MHRGKRLRGQSALDFMVSYGFAILVISISIYIVLQLSIFQPQLVSTGCTASPGFGCSTFTLFSNGTLRMVLVQVSGATMNITGAACSGSVNSTGNGPTYGNVRVLKYSAVPSLYPDSSFSSGILSYTDSSFVVSLYCYGPLGVASGSRGSVFTGYVWINYTSSNLPSSLHYVSRVASFTAKYE